MSIWTAKCKNGNCSIKFNSWVSHTSVYLLYLYLICGFFLILYSYPLFSQFIPYPLFFPNLSLIPYNFIYPLSLIFFSIYPLSLIFLAFISYPLRPPPPPTRYVRICTKITIYTKNNPQYAISSWYKV